MNLSRYRCNSLQGLLLRNTGSFEFVTLKFLLNQRKLLFL